MQQQEFVRLQYDGSIDVVKDCFSCFAIDLPSCVCKKGQDKFILLRYNSTANCFCKFCSNL